MVLDGTLDDCTIVSSARRVRPVGTDPKKKLPNSHNATGCTNLSSAAFGGLIGGAGEKEKRVKNWFLALSVSLADYSFRSLFRNRFVRRSILRCVYCYILSVRPKTNTTKQDNTLRNKILYAAARYYYVRCSADENCM